MAMLLNNIVASPFNWIVSLLAFVVEFIIGRKILKNVYNKKLKTTATQLNVYCSGFNSYKSNSLTVWTVIFIVLLCVFFGVGFGVQNTINADNKEYNITYVLNGGTNDEKNIKTFKRNDEFKLLAPQRYGYYFEGWYLDKTLTEYFNLKSSHNIIEHDLVLYAKWEIRKERISYDFDGAICTEELPKEMIYTSADYMLPVLEKEGYIFCGWTKGYTKYTNYKQEVKYDDLIKVNNTYCATFLPNNISTIQENEQMTYLIPKGRNEKYFHKFVPSISGYYTLYYNYWEDDNTSTILNYNYEKIYNEDLYNDTFLNRKPYTEQIYLTRGETYYIINSSKGTYSETSAKNYFKIYLS